MKQIFELNLLGIEDSDYCEIEIASICPQCNVSLIPEFIYGVKVQKSHDNRSVAFTLNYCPNCEECFVSRHIHDASSDVFLYDTSFPKRPTPVNWGSIIESVSPSFVEIYDQSSSAEILGLSQIAGVGYRKALEFLIKDYLISQTQDPDEILRIKRKPLGNCINENVDNPQLKIVSSRAVWLGNDQTHYDQRFSEMDISDLKRMIRLSVHWISLIKETEEAALIQSRK